MKKFFYIYVLLSLKDKKFYTGYTSNLLVRFGQHQKGLIPATKNRRPLELIYSEACLSQQDATHREKYLKTAYGKQFIKNRLKSYLRGIHPIK
jgi:putative endonuclease